MKKRIPEFSSDEEAERFVETADLTEYDLSHFQPKRFEFKAKAARLRSRLRSGHDSTVLVRADRDRDTT